MERETTCKASAIALSMLVMNWKILIVELQASGMSQAQIAAACDTGQSHISALGRCERMEPRHSLGQRLIELHTERVGEKAAA